MASTPIAPLVLVVLESIIEVFIITFAGYILAVQGILDKKTQKQLNRVNVSIFTPALLFGKVAFFLTPAKLAQLWVIPVFFVIITVVSAVVALALSTLFKLKRSQRNYSIAAAMFMNSNTLPIALMQSLVVTVPDLKWGSDDSQSAMLSRALTYLVLYSTLGMIVRWSFGVKLLASGDPDSDKHLNQSPTEPVQVASSNSAEGERTLRHEASTLTDVDDAKTLTHVRVEESKSLPGSRPISPELQPQASGSGASSLYAEEGVLDENTLLPPLENTIPESTPVEQPSRMQHTLNRLRRFWIGFYDFMTVPLWAALASIIVALIGPLQSFIEDHVPPITGAITQMGNCSIPITLVVLGGYFWRPADKSQLPTHQPPIRKGSKAWFSTLSSQLREKFSFRRNREPRSVQKENSGETTTVIVVILARMVITPLLLLPLLVVATKYNIQRLLEDPVFIVSNVLIIASPPALTLAQITQAASGDAFERLISRTIFWSYVVFTAPSTIIVVVIGLIIAKL
ncbi:auxin efflux carrier [Rhodofomes roseus]|uniref:Auxin efflux carrier n=1 Tax=Rhodofomes roseus TaxID=34475 RepID=A0A4Y9YCX2_9APHY|nr:auxin efflux carrier [Rhodofomes roseus]KAH9836106.1 auxin efflux carrier [Rhodofomes roseus]TFY60195.1 hypothetical protein EVJ58_g5306 [Rhodofomes roseus]